jgi:hypothetical protein
MLKLLNVAYTVGMFISLVRDERKNEREEDQIKHRDTRI